MLHALVGATDFLQELLFEGPGVGDARIFLFLVMADDASFRIAFGLFAVLTVGFNDTTLDFVFIFESDAL